MVGNATWDYPGREVGDYSRKETIEFAKWPKRTNKGWRWLVDVRRVSTIEFVPFTGGWLFEFLGMGGTVRAEVIRWESL